MLLVVVAVVLGEKGKAVVVVIDDDDDDDVEGVESSRVELSLMSLEYCLYAFVSYFILN